VDFGKSAFLVGGRDERLGLFGVLAFVGQLAILLRVEQDALRRDADPDQAELGIFETQGTGGGANALEAVQAVLPAQCDVATILVVGVDRDLVVLLARIFGGDGIGDVRFRIVAGDLLLRFFLLCLPGLGGLGLQDLGGLRMRFVDGGGCDCRRAQAGGRERESGSQRAGGDWFEGDGHQMDSG
jgi:hypothetical protein